jgi:hypothetical protein
MLIWLLVLIIIGGIKCDLLSISSIHVEWIHCTIARGPPIDATDLHDASSTSAAVIESDDCSIKLIEAIATDIRLWPTSDDPDLVEVRRYTFKRNGHFPTSGLGVAVLNWVALREALTQSLLTSSHAAASMSRFAIANSSHDNAIPAIACSNDNGTESIYVQINYTTSTAIDSQSPHMWHVICYGACCNDTVPSPLSIVLDDPDQWRQFDLSLAAVAFIIFIVFLIGTLLSFALCVDEG